MELLILIVIVVGLVLLMRRRNERTYYEYEQKKKGGCFKWFAIVCVVIVVMAAIGGTDSSSTVQNGYSSATDEKQTDVQDAPATEAPTPEPTAAPSTREEWVQRDAEEVYGDDLISVSWQEVDNQKDMIVIWCNFKDNFSNSLRRTMFMSDAKKMLQRVTQLGIDGHIEYSSCYIVGRTTYLDTYGNEFDGNAMEIRLKAEDLEKINWQNVNNDMLINLSTTYAVNQLFRD